MLASLVDQRGDFTIFNVIYPTATQWKAVARQIFDWRRKIELPVEPGLHGMLVRGNDVHQVVAFERSHVAGEYFRCDSLVTRGCPKTGCPLPTTNGNQGE